MNLHNTRTGTTDAFTPISDDTVTLYTCGPTVYSEPLIGNWVAYIRWDLLVRVLRSNDYKVRRVMNITDVGHLVSDADDGEDKMEKGAKREGLTAWEVAERYTNRFLEGMTGLNLLPPEIMPRATEHIPDQIALIEALAEKGFTYVITDGVYFDTSKFNSYADFARLDLDALRAGARIEKNEEKKNPSDFALWKFSPTDERRDMEWDSPWGKGFPGWHIECSAMAMKYLGETMDIHTGGIDHVPVHHTNEIAQSEAATGKRFANFWLHANFLLVNGTKISKSLQNGYTLSDLRAKGYTDMDFKLFVLQSHYRTESNFTFENLQAAANRYKHWRAVAAFRHQLTYAELQPEFIDTCKNRITELLSEDLNSPQTLAHIEEIFERVETSPSEYSSATVAELIFFIDEILGLRLHETTPDVKPEIRQLIDERNEARQSSDWDRADELRTQLGSWGIEIRDTTDGVFWNYA